MESINLLLKIPIEWNLHVLTITDPTIGVGKGGWRPQLQNQGGQAPLVSGQVCVHNNFLTEVVIVIIFLVIFDV